MAMQVLYYHDGEQDFPHGAGGCGEPGYYVYYLQPDEAGTTFHAEPEWIDEDDATAGQQAGRFAFVIVNMPRA